MTTSRRIAIILLPVVLAVFFAGCKPQEIIDQEAAENSKKDNIIVNLPKEPYTRLIAGEGSAMRDCDPDGAYFTLALTYYDAKPENAEAECEAAKQTAAEYLGGYTDISVKAGSVYAIQTGEKHFMAVCEIAVTLGKNALGGIHDFVYGLLRETNGVINGITYTLSSLPDVSEALLKEATAKAVSNANIIAQAGGVTINPELPLRITQSFDYSYEVEEVFDDTIYEVGTQVIIMPMTISVIHEVSCEFEILK